MTKPARMMILAALAVAAAGCANAFRPTTVYEAQAPTYPVKGKGGAFLSIQGVKIWTKGTPTQAYSVIGTIEDIRFPTKADVDKLDDDVVKLVKSHGGDGAITVYSELRGVEETDTTTQYRSYPVDNAMYYSYYAAPEWDPGWGMTYWPDDDLYYPTGIEMPSRTTSKKVPIYKLFSKFQVIKLSP